MNPTDISKHLKTTVSAYKVMKDFINKIKTPARHYLTPVTNSIERITEDFFCHKIGCGQQITTRGFLSKYTLISRPDFYIPYTHKAEDVVIKSDMSSPGSGHVTMKMAPYHTQIPIQIFPPILKENKKYYLYFLYYPSFKSFILKTDDDKIKAYSKNNVTDNILDIESLHKPILVISDKMLQSETECIVKITGILKEIDDDLYDDYIQNLSKTQREIFYNILRPYNEGATSLCIDLREDSYISKEESANTLPASIYVESHFENIPDNEIFNKIVGAALPGAYPGLHWFSSQNSGISSGLCNSDIFVVSKNFTHFAFYTPCDLLDQRNYPERLTQLQAFCDIFRKHVQNALRHSTGHEIKMVYDFLFDFRRASLFHPKGVLLSKEIESLLLNEPKFSDTVNWLKNV